ncbi:hypothetical protein [Fluviicola sp.]|uniref:hypothetical protein n=1 Tax=Fluviicola sp. TaxID=1917219 RepID=UPI003D26F295
MKTLFTISILLLFISSCGKVGQTDFKVVVSSPESEQCHIMITSDAHPVNSPQLFLNQNVSAFSYEWKEKKKTTIRVQITYVGSVDYPNYKISLYKKGKLVEESTNDDLEWKH